VATEANTSFVWRPEDHGWTAESHVARFMGHHGFATFEDLHAASVRDTGWFWQAALEDIGLRWQRPYETLRDDSRGFPWTRWFVGGRINITENCLDRHVAEGHGDELALVYEADSGDSIEARRLTFAELSAMTNRLAGGLRAAGIGPGDAVGLYAPMRVETVAAMFATFKLGARFVPIFCGFGDQAVAERLESCQAKLLLAAPTLRRRGKTVDVAATARSAASKASSVQQVVFFDSPEWDQLLAAEPVEDCPPTEAEAPCLIIYTSGTTGRPKGAVHTHAGCLAQTGKELRYAFDVRPGEPFFWLTDIGWMMGPWELIGCLLYRVPVVLFDGAPDHPSPDRLWETIERLGVVTFGISPTAIRLLMRARGARGPESFDLSRLRLLGSTGEPWDDASYRWFFERVGGGRCPIINISGGTEILGCHLQPHPVQPLKPCSLGAGALGMDVAVFNEAGQPVQGEVGYLVCRQPAPSMTKSFLGDDQRYLDTYFSRFPGVWYHGDWARIDEDGCWFLLGRADDTIKVAGKRVGPAEIESALTSHPAVSEAAAIGVPDEIKGQKIVCFAVLKPGQQVAAAELQQVAASQMGKPLAPSAIHFVEALPKTRSGKVLRALMRKAYLDEPIADLSSVENPSALDPIRRVLQASGA
jgi:acetyl-CoA synthetase